MERGKRKQFEREMRATEKCARGEEENWGTRQRCREINERIREEGRRKQERDNEK